MNSSRFRLTLDLHSVQSQYAIPVMVGDKNVSLLINITDGGVPFIIEDGFFAKLSIKRPTGTHIEAFCAIENKATIVYDFDQDAEAYPTAVEGVHECDITLYTPDGRGVGSPRFTMIVSPKVLRNDDIVLTDKDFTVVDAMVAAEAKRQAAETGRVIAEAARVEAEAERVEAEAERGETLQTILASEQSRVEAENIRVSNEAERLRVGEEARGYAIRAEEAETRVKQVLATYIDGVDALIGGGT